MLARYAQEPLARGPEAAGLQEPDFVLTAAPIYIGIAAVLLLAVWPTRRDAIRLIQRLGISDPTDLEIDEARRYLKRHRIPYAVIYLTLSTVTSLVLPSGRPPLEAILLAVALTGGFIAEGIAWSSGHTATPGGAPAPQYTARALIPGWTVTLAGILLGTLGVLSTAALLGQDWALLVIPSPAPALISVAAALLIATASVWLAVHRRARCSDRIDAALRQRSARVSVMLALLAAAAIAAYCGSAAAAYTFVALGFSGAIAMNCRRQPAVGPSNGGNQTAGSTGSRNDPAPAPAQQAVAGPRQLPSTHAGDETRAQ
ncbi:hypothetical protein K1T35_47795 (plasmid) [Pseudonocardia sp. DSM 110487]|uniref:hypothetical protein n=1 Tax=Pseudonocardia sp. DSM 110487 TaxID=2865833 RepID=UPI001C6A5AE4|nr:hypothetical protein [Pseudonocardia sp. DSM 110487]QYN41055.1 hypothetical protein K1T35_47795 [Pseudonocardia sp. DSM 110487]